MSLPKIVNIRVPIEPPPTHQANLRILKNKSTGSMFVGKMANSKATQWMKLFQSYLVKWTPPEPIAGPLRVTVNFGYALLQKHRRKNGGASIIEAKVTRPDVDNLVKMVLDCFVKSGYIVDDSNISSLSVSKWFHNKGPFVDVIVTVDHKDPWDSELKLNDLDHPTP